MRRLATLLILLALVGACSSKKDSSTTTTTSPTDTTGVLSTSTTATTSASSSGTTGTSSGGSSSQKLTSPEQAAAHLFLAWKDGDKNEAKQFATDAAVNELFKQKYTGPEPSFQGCDQQGNQFNCVYRYEGGAMIFRVEGSAAAGYRVTSYESIPD
jgi:hypothetical protein